MMETENKEEFGSIPFPKATLPKSPADPHSSPWSKDLSCDPLWQVRDTESSVTPKRFPDKRNDVIKGDILHLELMQRFLSYSCVPFGCRIFFFLTSASRVALWLGDV